MSDWIKHESDEPPELAPAALVELYTGVVQRVDRIRWDWMDQYACRYRPLTDDEGHKLISAEGLEDWAEWVATDADGEVRQYEWLADWSTDNLAYGYSIEAPVQFRHPGDWRDSLYRVEGR